MLSICIAETLQGHVLNQWSFVLSNFSIDRLFVIGDVSNLIHKPFANTISIENASFLPTDSDLILLAPVEGRYYKGNVGLKDFSHPSNAIYLFGPNHVHLSEVEMSNRKPDYSVYIETDTKDEMFSYVAAAVTLWDRRIKNG
jgi:hypothetical protein